MFLSSIEILFAFGTNCIETLHTATLSLNFAAMQRTAAELAILLNGSVQGNPEVSVSRLAKIEEGQSGDLTFLSNPDYEGFMYTSNASIAIVSRDFQPSKPLPDQLTLLRVEDPYAAFARLLEFVGQATARPTGIHPTAVIADNVNIPETCSIGPYVIIEDGALIGENTEIRAHAVIGRHAEIGAHCLLHAHVHVMDSCIVGAHCVLHPNVVVGSDGFGFAPQQDDSYRKIPQTGNVILEKGCEIGAGTTIDRATLGSTRICEGVKLDNHIQVAHNVVIGKHTVMAAQCGIAGSTSIGERCMIGGQVGIAGHLRIADGVKIAAQSGISASITKEGAIWQGTPAAPIKDFQKQQLALRKLTRSEWMRRVDQLEQQVNALKDKQ